MVSLSLRLSVAFLKDPDVNSIPLFFPSCGLTDHLSLRFPCTSLGLQTVAMILPPPPLLPRPPGPNTRGPLGKYTFLTSGPPPTLVCRLQTHSSLLISLASVMFRTGLASELCT